MLYHIYLKTSPTGTISGIQVLNTESAPNTTNETVNVVRMLYHIHLKTFPTGEVSGIQVLNAESAPNTTNETVNNVIEIVKYS